MRRPVRPFVKEFKTRSANLSPAARQSRRSSPDNMAVVEPAPARIEASLFSPPPPAPRASNPSDAYEAAMRAADAVFGKNLPTPAPGSSAPMGRVLPSLVETSVFADEPEPLAAPATDEVKPRRGRPPGKAKKQPIAANESPAAKTLRAVPAKRASAPVRPTPALLLDATPLAQPPVDVVALPESSAAAPSGQRERRSIQKRWVLKTALKPGEKWKRRLCEAAR